MAELGTELPIHLFSKICTCRSLVSDKLNINSDQGKGTSLTMFCRNEFRDRPADLQMHFFFLSEFCDIFKASPSFEQPLKGSVKVTATTT